MRSGSSATCPGPKLRLGELEGDVAVLHSGSQVVLRGETNGTPGSAELLTVQWDDFAKAVKLGRPGLPGRRASAAEGRLGRGRRR